MLSTDALTEKLSTDAHNITGDRENSLIVF